MALWNGVGQVANIAQLTGVDAYGLISMIVEAAKTVKRNQETCQLLARRVRMIGDLLQQLESSQLMQHTETRNPVEQLEETLRHAYVLIASCGDSSYLRSCFTGGKQAELLHEVQNEITFYLHLFPLVSFVDATRTLERVRNTYHASCSQVTTDGSHEQHHPECDDRLRTMDLEVIKFTPQEKSGEKRTKGEVMDIGELANFIGGGKVTELSYFSFSQILTATKQFSARNLISSGGFGDVYKGKLSNGLDIAVKRRRTDDSPLAMWLKEYFRTEVQAIPNLRHKNIIALLGCCTEGGEQILVYEYMPNKCLASIISDKTKRVLLKWCKRLQIIKAVADGLAYLHGHPQMRIVLRDLGSSNILLDHDMNAKISGFGLAIMLAPDTYAEMDIISLHGFAAPEYMATGRISEDADMYNFGVIVLEIISGRKALCYPMFLPDYAYKHRKNVQKLFDPLLDAKGHEWAQIMECIKVALLCTHSLPENRPSMSEVVNMLDSIQAVRP